MTPPPVVLVSQINVGPLAPGATVTLPHGIYLNRTKKARPDRVWPTSITGIRVVSADDTNVVFENINNFPESAVFIATYRHSIGCQPGAPDDFYQGPGPAAIIGNLPVYRNANDTCTNYPDPPISERPDPTTKPVGYEIWNVSDQGPNYVGFKDPFNQMQPDFTHVWLDVTGVET